MCTALQANGICGEVPFEAPLQGLDGARRHQWHGPRVLLVRGGKSSQQGMGCTSVRLPRSVGNSDVSGSCGVKVQMVCREHARLLSFVRFVLLESAQRRRISQTGVSWEADRGAQHRIRAIGSVPAPSARISCSGQVIGDSAYCTILLAQKRRKS